MGQALTSLTPTQREIVSHTGSAAIIAAPGSGKTTLLVEKVASLVTEFQIPLPRILVVTFTEKAAAELKERLGKRLPQWEQGLREAPIGTIHATRASWLRRSADRLGLNPRFEVLEESVAELQRLRVARETLLEALRREDRPTFSLVESLGGYRQTLRKIPPLLTDRITAPEPYATPLARIREAYQEKKRAAGRLDFQDLEDLGDQLLDLEDFRGIVQQELRWIVVDEFQDVRDSQWRNKQKIHHPDRNRLVIVGDPRQSIYRFRGANPAVFQTAIREIEQEGGTTFYLDINFRSRPEVIEPINRLLPQLFPDFPRPMVPNRPPSSNAGVFSLSLPEGDLEVSRQAEASVLLEKLQDLRQEGFEWKEIALLFRTRRAMPLLESQLEQAGIPFETAAGEPLLERPEVLNFLFSLQRIADPENRMAEIGLEFFRRLSTKSLPILESLKKLVIQLQQFESLTLSELFHLLQSLRAMEARIPIPESIGSKEGVRLMTIHSAKGLEYPVIFLCDLQGRVPSQRPPYLKDDAGKMILPTEPSFEALWGKAKEARSQESDRLLYVALTRARERIYLPIPPKPAPGSWGDTIINNLQVYKN